VDSILNHLVEVGRITPDDAETLVTAESLYADLHHALRFVVGTSATDPTALSAPARHFICTVCDSPDIEALRGRITGHQTRIEALFDRLFPPPSD
jgi:hypothetical protein